MLRRILDSPWLYFTAAAVLLVAAIASQFELSIPSRPRGDVEDIAALRERDDLNVVFILVDTLRADRLGVYGYERPTTPILDDLARHGIVFRHVLSQSTWTKTSMASLWTSTYPVHNGILRFNHALPDEAVMPAEVFREAGFRTAGVWRNGWVAPNFGFGQGFEIYVRPTPGRERIRFQRRSPTSNALKGTDEDIVNSAREFLHSYRDQRFLLYAHFMDVHQYLYDNGAPNFGTSYSDAYDSSINWTDRVIGELIRELDELDLLKRTLIAVSADHGEAFREHGFEGHARNLYRETTEVPFILIPPVILEDGIVVDRLVSNVDVWPTLLDLVGLPPLPNADGISLVPLILAAGGAEPAPPTEAFDRPVYSQLDQAWGQGQSEPSPLIGVARGNLRLFHKPSRPERDELYDHSADPAEQENLAAERAADAQPLRALATDYFENGASPWGGGPEEVELDEMRLNQLRALGYVVK